MTPQHRPPRCAPKTNEPADRASARHPWPHAQAFDTRGDPRLLTLIQPDRRTQNRAAPARSAAARHLCPARLAPIRLARHQEWHRPCRADREEKRSYNQCPRIVLTITPKRRSPRKMRKEPHVTCPDKHPIGIDHLARIKRGFRVVVRFSPELRHGPQILHLNNLIAPAV